MRDCILESGRDAVHPTEVYQARRACLEQFCYVLKGSHEIVYFTRLVLEGVQQLLRRIVVLKLVLRNLLCQPILVILGNFDGNNI